MLAFWKLIVLGLISLTLIYGTLRIYFRSVRREHLEATWDTAQGEDMGPKDAFVDAGVERYMKTMSRRLAWLVYGVPIALVTALVLFMNVQQ